MDLFDSIPQKKSTPEFQEAYLKLNEAQRKAVDTLDGPVMVIAGPGTGKTQILAVRIGAILLERDVNPSNILCLTYTDAGASEMRSRLSRFIGPAAFDIQISTFHSFCMKIMREHSELFAIREDAQNISELESYKIMQDLFSKLDKEHILFDYRQYYDHKINTLSSAIQTIATENFNFEQLRNDYLLFEKKFISDPDNRYKRKVKEYSVGDLNQTKYKEFKAKMNTALAYIELAEQYQIEKQRLGFFDFNDMIKNVLDKLKSNSDLLAEYQEQYQYILVDEFQDNNGIQNEILNLLVSFDDHPNLFIVGDDDQAIFRFQGAKVDNMESLQTKFNPQLIVLEENYRSTQEILDAAKQLIEYNTKRLINHIPGLSKNLRSVGDNRYYKTDLRLIEYPNYEIERYQIVSDIESKIKSGISSKEIAVLCRKNKDLSAYALSLKEKKIDYQISKTVNLLDEQTSKQLILILRFIVLEKSNPRQQEHLLYEILHFPFWQVSTYHIGKMSLWVKQKESKRDQDDNNQLEYILQDLLTDAEQLRQLVPEAADQLLDFHQKILGLVQSQSEYSVQVFLEKIIHDLGILPFILKHENHQYLIQLLYSFFEWIKAEAVKNPDYELKQYLEMLDLMMASRIAIPMTKVLGNPEGVKLFTLHASKGLEFDCVYIPQSNSSQWDSKRGRNGITFPYQSEDVLIEQEEQRRLFYVGMTRAKMQLHISYGLKNTNGKDDPAIRFIHEITKEDLVVEKKIVNNQEDFLGDLAHQFNFGLKKFIPADESVFHNFIQKFRLSPTSLNSYLKCPVSFYYQKVLQVPSARTASLGYGNAVHYVLEKTVPTIILEKTCDFDNILKLFKKGMKKYKSHFTDAEFEQYSMMGSEHLPQFVQHYMQKWIQIDYSISEKSYADLYISEVPITGKLDRVDFIENSLAIIDYKTGSTASISEKLRLPSDKEPTGGEYWKQMVFYCLMMDQLSEHKTKIKSSTFYFVNKDKDKGFIEKSISPTDEDKNFVSQLIQESYQKISSNIFTPGCGKPDCLWCNYIDSGVLLHKKEDSEEDEFE